jgi:DNA modification methylase
MGCQPNDLPMEIIVSGALFTNHCASQPLTVLLPLLEAFSAPGGLVLDPFAGSGSSLLAAKQLGRDWLGFELAAEYRAAASARLAV